MSDSEECSIPKKARNCFFSPFEEIDIKLEEDDVSTSKPVPTDDICDFFFGGGDNEDDEQQELTSESFNVPGTSSMSTDTELKEDSIKLDVKPTTSSEWSASCVLKNVPFNKENKFLGKVGSEPIDFFNFFFEEELLSFICQQTNIEAKKQMLLATTHSRINIWKDLTVSEMRIFLGVLFHMGTLSLPRVQDYWRGDRLFALPIFRESMPRNRFMIIMKCLRFNVENESATDPLFKIRYLINYFNNKMESCYYPGKNLTLDESMFIWHGRLRPKKFVIEKNSPGIEISTLTEPDGLVLNLVAHYLAVSSAKKGHAEGIVMELLKNKLHNGHSLYMDISYNSIGLAKTLLENNTYCTGELSKYQTDIREEVLEAKEKFKINPAICEDGVVIGKWRHPSNRDMLYLSTEFPFEMMPTQRQTIFNPVSVVKYKEFKLGIDRDEQILAFYPCDKMEFPWPTKLAIHIFQLLLVNSHKIFNKISKVSGYENKMLFYDYRLKVIDKLLPKHQRTRGSMIDTMILPEDLLQHKISKITERLSNGQVKRKTCRQCSKSRKRKDSYFHCLTCDSEPGLCFECFDDYHTSLLV